MSINFGVSSVANDWNAEFGVFDWIEISIYA